MNPDFHILFDLDETLIDTSALVHHRKTPSGQAFLASNLLNDQRLVTAECHPALKSMLHFYSLSGVAAIITNSPMAYANAVLQKHSYPKVPIFASANKPNVNLINLISNYNGKAPDRLIIVGDSSRDILAAHQSGIPSIAVTWGKTNTKQQLIEAEPTALAENYETLEKLLEDFEKGHINYIPRKNLTLYSQLPVSEYLKTPPNITPLFLGEYTPSSGGAMNDLSRNILTFKGSKSFTPSQIINDKLPDWYFRNSYPNAPNMGLVYRKTYLDVLMNFINGVNSVIKSSGLGDNFIALSAPNSCPEFCYGTDINDLLVYNLAENKRQNTKMIYRIFPKPEAHNWGRTTTQEHYKTIGFKLPNPVPRLSDNVIIFDDIWTSGTQIHAMAAMLRYFGIGTNFYSITLGKTI